MWYGLGLPKGSEKLEKGSGIAAEVSVSVLSLSSLWSSMCEVVLKPLILLTGLQLPAWGEEGGEGGRERGERERGRREGRERVKGRTKKHREKKERIENKGRVTTCMCTNVLQLVYTVHATNHVP